MTRLLAGVYPGASGPAVAAVFQRLLALVFLCAWISLGWQVRLLIGERGLEPLWLFLEEAAPHGLPPAIWPSLLRWQPLATDTALVGGAIVGAALAVIALAGVRPRLCFALSTALYLSYTVACRGFLAFQWDNLLLECGLLASFLPADRAAPVAHLLLRLVAFKLYFQSGLAKWSSPEGDWRAGTAMAFYYETAPLPTALAFFAHQLPAWWHRLESWATLGLELVLPFAMFGPRRARLAAAIGFTAFQVIDAATANYGFFCYLSAALHVFLLEDRDLPRWAVRLARAPAPPPPGRFEVARARLAWFGLGAYVLASVLTALPRLSRAGWADAGASLRRLYEPFRVVNAYHLFASVTTERIEPELQVLKDGRWRPLHLRHKPGDPRRAPGLVAPHQPRVDFLLWFHGLGWQHQPGWVSALLVRLCHDRPAVAPLFAAPLPRDPEAARVEYFRYRFSTAAERRATGAWWQRTPVGVGPVFPCGK